MNNFYTKYSDFYFLFTNINMNIVVSRFCIFYHSIAVDDQFSELTLLSEISSRMAFLTEIFFQE